MMPAFPRIFTHPLASHVFSKKAGGWLRLEKARNHWDNGRLDCTIEWMILVAFW